MHKRANKEAGIAMLVADGGAGACQLDHHGPREGSTNGSTDLWPDKSSSRVVNPQSNKLEKF